MQSTKTLLIRGGTSSVGIAALLLAKAQGVKVTSTTRNENKLAELKELGANDVVLDKGDLETSERYDAILELVGTKTLLDSLRHVKETGYTVVTGGLGGEWSLENFSPFEINGYLANFQSTVVDREDITALMKLVGDNGLSLPIIQEFKLRDVGKALSTLEETKKMGKIVITNN